MTTIHAAKSMRFKSDIGWRAVYTALAASLETTKTGYLSKKFFGHSDVATCQKIASLVNVKRSYTISCQVSLLNQYVESLNFLRQHLIEKARRPSEHLDLRQSAIFFLLYTCFVTDELIHLMVRVGIVETLFRQMVSDS